MVDFHSRYKLYSYGYTSPIVREVPSKRHHEHEVSRHLHLNDGYRPVHDCRPDVVKEFYDPKDWETQLLAMGLNESYEKSETLHIPLKHKATKQDSGDKKIFQTGTFGTGNECFNYPRGLTTSDWTCDVIVADTQNHCIKIFNQCGVFKRIVGSYGKKTGQFNEPTGICEFENGDFGVADRRNKRVQVFSKYWKFRFTFPTVNIPYGITCNSMSNIIVSSVSKKIEVYERNGDLMHMFSVDGPSTANSPLPICTNDKDEIIVCDPGACMIKFYSLGGRLLHQFQPECPEIGRTVIPCGICLSMHVQHVLVADSLNHTVNLYTQNGNFLEQIIGPTDDVGTINSISCGPEGHLVITEFSVTGEHCIKIFKYTECKCHKGRVLSSKRSTPKDFSMSW